MGSGSSKAGGQNAPKTHNTAPRKPVANVNKQELPHVESGNSLSKTAKQNDSDRFGSQSPTKSVGTLKNDKKIQEKDREKEKEKKKDKTKNNNKGGWNNSASALQFEEDSDVDNDIDEVLRIPVADNSRQSRDRDKKNKKDKNKENFAYDGVHDYPRNNRQVSSERTEDLPETYAQRLQRQQYKLQQDMLLREKTIVRNPREWHNDDDDDNDDMDTDSPRGGGFDASKFRAANRGGDTKKDIFTTVPDDLQTPRYLQSTGQTIDEVDVRKREDISPNRQLPRYNQSELDLMRQLEEDIL